MRITRATVVAAPIVALAITVTAGCGHMLTADEKYKKELAASIAASYNANQSRATAVPTAPVDAAFLARANAMCVPVVAYNAAHPNPYPTFDYNNPDVATLKLEGAYFSASPFNGALSQLIALTPPGQNAATWQTLTKTATALRDQVAAQNAAALAGDKAAFTATIAPIQRLAGTLLVDGHQAGFADDAACMQMFGG